jgi:large subunit ribosomal protein L28
MAKCRATGRKPAFGNNVSHAQNRTRRKWKPNVQARRIFVLEEKRWVRIHVSAAGLRNMDKHGGLVPWLRSQGLTLKDVLAS